MQELLNAAKAAFIREAHQTPRGSVNEWMYEDKSGRENGPRSITHLMLISATGEQDISGDTTIYTANGGCSLKLGQKLAQLPSLTAAFKATQEHGKELFSLRQAVCHAKSQVGMTRPDAESSGPSLHAAISSCAKHLSGSAYHCDCLVLFCNSWEGSEGLDRKLELCLTAFPRQHLSMLTMVLSCQVKHGDNTKPLTFPSWLGYLQPLVGSRVRDNRRCCYTALLWTLASGKLVLMRRSHSKL